jgi:hypothetical protein
MLSGPKGSEEPSSEQCGVCGRRMELCELPGRSGKYCLECSADVATSMLLKTEIDAATLAGRETEGLVAEFAELSHGCSKDRSRSGNGDRRRAMN